MTIHTDIDVTVGGLALTTATGYVVTGRTLGDPARTWRRNYASSEWVDGSFLLSAVLEHTTLPMQVRVTGTSIAQMRTRMQALLDAVSVFNYTVVIDMEGTAQTWNADPADYSLDGGAWQDGRLRTFHQLVNLVIPVHPVVA